MASITAFVEPESMQLGSAVVDILNDGTVNLPATAKRSYMPSVELSAAGDASVLVAVTGRSIRREHRGTTEHTIGTIPSRKPFSRMVRVEIGLNKKFNQYSDIETGDPQTKLAEQIADLFASIRVPVSSTLAAFPVNEGSGDAVNHSPFYDPKLWKENMQFTAIITVNYRLVDIA